MKSVTSAFARSAADRIAGHSSAAAAQNGAARQAGSNAFDLAVAPPVAKRVDHAVESPHGARNDEYYWLRDDDPRAKRAEVMDYLRAEHAYTDLVMAPQARLRELLVREMRARIKEDDSSAPQYDNGYWYWRRYDAGAEYRCMSVSAGQPRRVMKTQRLKRCSMASHFRATTRSSASALSL